MYVKSLLIAKNNMDPSSCTQENYCETARDYKLENEALVQIPHPSIMFPNPHHIHSRHIDESNAWGYAPGGAGAEGDGFVGVAEA